MTQDEIKELKEWLKITMHTVLINCNLYQAKLQTRMFSTGC